MNPFLFLQYLKKIRPFFHGTAFSLLRIKFLLLFQYAIASSKSNTVAGFSLLGTGDILLKSGTKLLNESNAVLLTTRNSSLDVILSNKAPIIFSQSRFLPDTSLVFLSTSLVVNRSKYATLAFVTHNECSL